MKITTRGETLTVILPDGRTATVPFDPASSLLSRAGRAAVRIAASLAANS